VGTPSSINRGRIEVGFDAQGQVFVDNDHHCSPMIGSVGVCLAAEERIADKIGVERKLRGGDVAHQELAKPERAWSPASSEL
jgi:hypothetical protein